MCILVFSSSLAELGEGLSEAGMVVDVGRRFGRHVRVKNRWIINYKWIACEIAVNYDKHINYYQ